MYRIWFAIGVGEEEEEIKQALGREWVCSRKAYIDINIVVEQAQLRNQPNNAQNFSWKERDKKRNSQFSLLIN